MNGLIEKTNWKLGCFPHSFHPRLIRTHLVPDHALT